MIGIIALFLLVIIFVVVHSIANRFANDFSSENNPKLRKRLYWIALGFIIIVLVGDEIIGGAQLAYFCQSEPKVQVLVSNLDGRKVKGTSTYRDKENAILSVRKGKEILVDINTQEIVASGYRYTSKGGWLSRTINFNGSKIRSSCSNVTELYQLPVTNNMKLQRN